MAVLLGHVGQDPEIKLLTSGDKVARFSVATSESWKDKASGEKKERTEWHTIVTFNENLVGIIEQYMKKGTQVYIQGKITTRKWQDKDGNDRYSTEIHLTGFDAKIQLCGQPGGGSKRPAMPDEPDERAVKGKGGKAPARDTDFDDEIPF